MRQIARDPFSRSTLCRETLPQSERKPCAWCGAHTGRFRYGWENDGIRTRPAFDRHPFCSVGCYRAHTGQD